ncbi:MAG: META domain-containing protein [Bauldia sp.]
MRPHALAALVTAVVLSGAAVAPAAAQPIPMDVLRNATFFNILDQGEITLTDGAWDAAPPDGIAHLSARLLDISASGDLDGDGTDETVALLVYSGGGTGQFLHAVVFTPTPDGGIAELGTAMIGDRNPVRGLAVEDGQIILDIVTQGPNDGACCPTEKARVILTLGDGTLDTVSIESEGTVSLADIDGEWTLVGLNTNEPPLPDAPITATFAGGAASGSSGCNTYTTSYKASSADDPSAIAFAPAATTRMACAGPLLQQEQTFLDRLTAVTNFYWDAGRLSLGYVVGDTYGALTFERVTTP